MLLAHMAGDTELLAEYDPLCDDLRVMRDALCAIRATVPGQTAEVQLGDSATAMRFLTALCACTPGMKARLHPSVRLARRPLTPLPELLKIMGAGPVDVRGGVICISGARPHYVPDLKLPSSISSQVCSALMMQGVNCEGGMELNILPPVLSRPYIFMTLRSMLRCGATAEFDGQKVRVAPGRYHMPMPLVLESDWSAASYIYELAALTRRRIELPGLWYPARSAQGDARCATLFDALGVHTTVTEEGVYIEGGGPTATAIEADMSSDPDLVPALAVTASLRGVPFRLTGVGDLRHKESDRLTALTEGLAALGRRVVAEGDVLASAPVVARHRARRSVVLTGSDHRIAMAFAVGAAWTRHVRIDNAACVSKSFPCFWGEMHKAGLTMMAETD